ncbi:Uncharacterised protein [Porphyromonas cangingivalis]|nr:Uncharacterised protein [Porphyromonas cangingivalis]
MKDFYVLILRSDVFSFVSEPQRLICWLFFAIILLK